MADFWWHHVVPAKRALAAGMPEAEVRRRFCPANWGNGGQAGPWHPWAALVNSANKRLMAEARKTTIRFEADQMQEAIAGACCDMEEERGRGSPDASATATWDVAGSNGGGGSSDDAEPAGDAAQAAAAAVVGSWAAAGS
jgi:hypothetical protein